MAKRGYLTGCVLTFAHTVGEFGVVLMMGGNIPGETRVLSIAIYEHVETLNYDAAHVLALGLLRGVQDTTVPMIMATISYWIVGLPISYVLAFPLGMGGVGIWLGLVVGLTVAGILMMWRFWRQAVFINAA